MKKLILGLTCLILVYTGFWFYNAGVAKDVVNEKWDDAALLLNQQGYSLQNEGLSVKGFPFRYEVEIKSPKIKRTGKNQVLSNPVRSIALDGTLNLSSNLTGTNFTVLKMGDSHISIENVEKSQPKVDEYVISGNTTLTFNVEEKSYLQAIFNPFKEIFGAIKNNDKEFLFGKKGILNFDGLHLINDENPAVTIFEIEKGAFSYTVEKTDGHLSFVQITSDMKGLNADTLLMGTEAYTPGREKSLKEIAILLSLPKPGNISLSFELDLTAPFNQLQEMNTTSTLEDIPSFNFDLKKLEVSSSFGTASHQANLSFQNVTEKLKKFHLDGLGTSIISKEEFETLKRQWDQFLNNLPVCEGGNAEKIDAACPLIKSLIPKLDEFGKITAEIDLDFEITNFKNPIQDAKLLIKKINYFSDIYGLKSNGFAEFNESLVSTYKIELINYQTLLNDLFSYLQRIQTLLPFINPQAAEVLKITDKQLAMIIRYLKEVSDDPTQDLKNLTITIKMNSLDQIQVGTLSEKAFTRKTEKLFSELANDFKVKKQEVEKQDIDEKELK